MVGRTRRDRRTLTCRRSAPTRGGSASGCTSTSTSPTRRRRSPGSPTACRCPAQCAIGSCATPPCSRSGTRDHVPVGLGRSSRVIPERTRRLVVHRDDGHCQVPGCARTPGRDPPRPALEPGRPHRDVEPPQPLPSPPSPAPPGRAGHPGRRRPARDPRLHRRRWPPPPTVRHAPRRRRPHPTGGPLPTSLRGTAPAPLDHARPQARLAPPEELEGPLGDAHTAA